jgi:hypothetical protein
VVITFLFLYFLKKLLIFENSLFTLFILNIMILFEKPHAKSQPQEPIESPQSSIRSTEHMRKVPSTSSSSESSGNNKKDVNQQHHTTNNNNNNNNNHQLNYLGEPTADQDSFSLDSIGDSDEQVQLLKSQNSELREGLLRFSVKVCVEEIEGKKKASPTTTTTTTDVVHRLHPLQPLLILSSLLYNYIPKLFYFLKSDLVCTTYLYRFNL